MRIGDDGGGNFTCSGNAQVNVHHTDDGLYFVCRERPVTVDISGNCDIWVAGPFKLGNPGQQGDKGEGDCDMTMSGGTIDCENMPIGVDTQDDDSASTLDMTAAPMLTKGDIWSFTTGCDLIDGDINLDCVVNFLDYAMMADDWRECVFFPDDVTP